MKYSFKDYLKDKYKTDSLTKAFLQIFKKIGRTTGFFLFGLMFYIGILLIATVIGTFLKMIPMIDSIGLDGMDIGVLFIVLIVVILSLYAKIKETISEYRVAKLNKEIETLNLEIEERKKRLQSKL